MNSVKAPSQILRDSFLNRFPTAASQNSALGVPKSDSGVSSSSPLSAGTDVTRPISAIFQTPIVSTSQIRPNKVSAQSALDLQTGEVIKVPSLTVSQGAKPGNSHFIPNSSDKSGLDSPFAVKDGESFIAIIWAL